MAREHGHGLSEHGRSHSEQGRSHSQGRSQRRLGCPSAPPPNARAPACVRLQVLVGIVLLATVFAAGIAVGARRRSAASGLLASEAAGSWSPVAVKLSAEGDYDRFGR